METWLVILISISLAVLLKSLLSQYLSSKNLPPGPPAFPIIGNLIWLRNSFSDIEHILRHKLRPIHGPIITLRIGSNTAVIIGSHSSAHRALIQNSVAFSGRPSGLATSKFISSNQHNITSAPYGATWRLLRRNLTSEILHPSRLKSYSHIRSWVFQILLERLSLAMSSSDGVQVINHFQYAMFCLLVLMCFGDNRDEDQILKIEKVQRDYLLSYRKFDILNFFPRLGKVIFRGRWNQLKRLRKSQEETLIPIIRSRLQQHQHQEEKVMAYVDTLVNLELPEEKRKLSEEEMVTLCSEFLNAGTDTTSTSLQWILANLVKYPEIQSKLYNEIVTVVGPKSKQGKNEGTFMIKEEDLAKMPYLKAVILEGLRRHPPGHFVLPHSVMYDVELDGYVIPKGTTVNFMVADMGWDPEVWDDPMEFKPERFLVKNNPGENCIEKDGFDITGSREIKMMPFGVGRRICPGANLALLNLEIFVANLVWYFEWKSVEGDEVDLTEKLEFTFVMKNPLRVNLCPRG